MFVPWLNPALSLSFKLSPVTSRPLVQSWFQWGSLKDMPDRNAWTFRELGTNAIFQEDHLHYNAARHPGCLIVSSMCLRRKGESEKVSLIVHIRKQNQLRLGQMLSSRHTSHLNIYHSVTSSQKPLLETTLPLKDNCARIAWEGQGMARDRARSIIYQCPTVLK